MTMKEINHSTADEKKFLSRIGIFAIPFRIFRDESPEERKIRLLKNYRESMKNRFFWGDVNRYEISTYVNFLILKESAN